MLQKSSAVILLSGGLDSVSNLYLALEKYNVVLSLTLNYGHRAFEKEKASAAYFSKKFSIPHEVVDVSSMFTKFGKSSLVDRNLKVPTHNSETIDDHQFSLKTAKAVWVPNRNGIFLNIAAGFAESLAAKVIIPGFNLEEASTFPDNSEDFLKAISTALWFSTANQVRAECLTTGLNKTEIVGLLKTKNLEFDKLWMCYHALDQWCGVCESCQRSKRAFKANHISLTGFKEI